MVNWEAQIFKSLQEAEAKIETLDIKTNINIKMVEDHILEKFLVAWGGPFDGPVEP